MARLRFLQESADCLRHSGRLLAFDEQAAATRIDNLGRHPNPGRHYGKCHGHRLEEDQWSAFRVRRHYEDIHGCEQARDVRSVAGKLKIAELRRLPLRLKGSAVGAVADDQEARIRVLLLDKLRGGNEVTDSFS